MGMLKNKSGSPARIIVIPGSCSAAQIALKKLNKVTVIGRGGFGKV